MKKRITNIIKYIFTIIFITFLYGLIFGYMKSSYNYEDENFDKILIVSLIIPLLLVPAKYLIEYFLQDRDNAKYYLEQWKLNEELFKNKLISANDHKNRQKTLKERYRDVYKVKEKNRSIKKIDKTKNGKHTS